MTQLLNRLLERQRALLQQMDDLDRPPAPDPKPEPRDPSAEAAALADAERSMVGGDLLAAERILSPYLRRASSVRTLTTLARIYTQLDRLDDAIEALKQAEPLGAEERKVWTLLARLYKAKNDPQKEVVYWRRVAFATDQPPVEAYTRLLSALIRSRPANSPLPPGEIKTIVDAFEATPNRSAEEVVQFAQAIYSLSVYRPRAIELMRGADPCPEGYIDVSASWTPLAQWCVEQGVEFRRSDLGVAGHRPTLACVPDATVDPGFHWIPVLGHGEDRAALLGFHFGRRTPRSVDPTSPLLLDGGDQVELRIATGLPPMYQPALLVGSADGMFRYLLDRLSMLAVAESLGIDPHVALLTGPPIDGQEELHALLGIAPGRLQRLERTACFTQLWLAPSPTVPGVRIDSLLPGWCRSRLDDQLKAVGRERHVVYLSHEDQGLLAVDEESRLIDQLASRGVEICIPHRAGLAGTVTCLRRADVVISVAAEWLTAVVFAEPGLHIIELAHVSSKGRAELVLDELFDACGHVRTPCEGTAVVPASQDFVPRIAVDVTGLMAAVDQAAAAFAERPLSSPSAASALQ